jgi:hypothetical protein
MPPPSPAGHPPEPPAGYARTPSPAPGTAPIPARPAHTSAHRQHRPDRQVQLVAHPRRLVHQQQRHRRKSPATPRCATGPATRSRSRCPHLPALASSTSARTPRSAVRSGLPPASGSPPPSTPGVPLSPAVTVDLPHCRVQFSSPRSAALDIPALASRPPRIPAPPAPSPSHPQPPASAFPCASCFPCRRLLCSTSVHSIPAQLAVSAVSGPHRDARSQHLSL